MERSIAGELNPSHPLAADPVIDSVTARPLPPLPTKMNQESKISAAKQPCEGSPYPKSPVQQAPRLGSPLRSSSPSDSVAASPNSYPFILPPAPEQLLSAHAKSTPSPRPRSCSPRILALGSQSPRDSAHRVSFLSTLGQSQTFLGIEDLLREHSLQEMQHKKIESQPSGESVHQVGFLSTSSGSLGIQTVSQHSPRMPAKRASSRTCAPDVLAPSPIQLPNGVNGIMRAHHQPLAAHAKSGQSPRASVEGNRPMMVTRRSLEPSPNIAGDVFQAYRPMETDEFTSHTAAAGNGTSALEPNPEVPIPQHRTSMPAQRANSRTPTSDILHLTLASGPEAPHTVEGWI